MEGQKLDRMPMGLKSLKVNNVLGKLDETVKKGKEIAKAQGQKKSETLSRKLAEHGHDVPLVDLQIQFIGASGLPKMDVVGSADPYFVAQLDDRLTFVSNVIANTLSPVWNEVWRIKNVPSTATLRVSVYDKDEGSARDDVIGSFTSSVTAGAKEFEIQGPLLAFRKGRGTFWLKVDSTPGSAGPQPREFQYLFDGPIRYTRHFSPTVGLFTASSTVRGTGGIPASQHSTATPGGPVQDPRRYSTWKFHIKGVPLFFRDVCQSWNRDYPAAQKIFGPGPGSLAVRSTVQAGHNMLYARLASNGHGTLDTKVQSKDTHGLDLAPQPDEPITLKQILHAGSKYDERIKPAIYTYIISAKDDTLRFSETGAAFFVDFASKHALHSNCATEVRYSGEFHPRPVGGWANFNDGISDDDVDWELVVDNNSGTYAPDKGMLDVVKACLEYNFGCGLHPRDPGKKGFRVVVHDREDEPLVESVKATREYAVNVRGVKQEDLQPHVSPGEVPLSHAAANGPVPGESFQF